MFVWVLITIEIKNLIESYDKNVCSLIHLTIAWQQPDIPAHK